MRAMKCWKRLTAFLLSFVMVLGLVLTNGITSEAARKETAWTEDGEIEVTVPSVMYKTHVQSFGWEKSWKKDGQSSGTFGKAKRLEAIQIHVDGGYGIGIEYRTHVQSIGWQGWKHDGQLSGTSGQSKRLEAIQIRLTGNNADLYDGTCTDLWLDGLGKKWRASRYSRTGEASGGNPDYYSSEMGISSLHVQCKRRVIKGL